MKMSINEAMNHIKYGIVENNYPLQRDLGIEACNLAIDTMHKYEKIEQILDDCDLEAWEVLEEIRKVVKDGECK
jgi:hypothetical protein